MEAPTAHRALVLFALSTALLLPPAPGWAAGYRTKNFVVDAPTPSLAKEIGDEAERCRSRLADEWLGHQLPPWAEPCPIKAKVSPQLGAGGATSFVFDNGQVFGWRMNIQGSRERILDSVVPHEVTHTIFATHFRQPLPRWADEGACTTVEHASEIAKQDRMLIEFLTSRRGIPFSNMFGMTEYPRDVLPLYAQGYSLVKYMIAQRGKAAFITFLEDGLAEGDWLGAVERHYGYADLLTLQSDWNNWIRQGQPPVETLVAATGPNVPSERPRPLAASGSRPEPVTLASGWETPNTVTQDSAGTEGIPAANHSAGRTDWSSIYDAGRRSEVFRR